MCKGLPGQSHTDDRRAGGDYGGPLYLLRQVLHGLSSGCQGSGRRSGEGEADDRFGRESVFFDFDIIQLTFNKEGEYTVIPVVSNPITIVDDVTPPTNIPTSEVQWWRIILALVLLVLLLILLSPILPQILNGIIWYIMLPIKVIRANRNRKNERFKDDYYKEE